MATNNIVDETFKLRLQKYSLASLLACVLAYTGNVILKSLAIAPAYLWMHDVGDLLRDVAIALAVGVYLMWTLERLSAAKIEGEVRQYIHAVGEGFIKAVYGKQLPDALFDVIKATILEQSFVRTAYAADVRLNDLQKYAASAPPAIKFHLDRFIKSVGDTAAKFLLVQFVSSYVISNVSLQKAQYKIYWELVKPFGGSYPGLIGLTSVLIGGKQQLSRLYVDNDDPASDPSHLSLKRVIDVEPGATITIQIDSYSIRTRDDKETWQVMIPCNGMSTTVVDLDTNSDVLIWLDAPSVDGTTKSAVKDPQTNITRLSVAQYLLPYQGMTLYWRPAIEKGASPVGETSERSPAVGGATRPSGERLTALTS